MKTECDYLYGWIKKKKVTYAKISPKMVNPGDIAGNAEEEEGWLKYGTLSKSTGAFTPRMNRKGLSNALALFVKIRKERGRAGENV